MAKGFLFCAHSEFERVANLYEHPAGYIPIELFEEGEKKFEQLLALPVLAGLHRKAYELGAINGFPRDIRKWPTRIDLGAVGTLENLQRSTEIGETWATTYGVNLSAFATYLISAAVMGVVDAILPLSRRRRNDTLEGTMLWSILRGRNSSVVARLKDDPKLLGVPNDVRERVPVVLGNRLLQERVNCREIGATSTLWAGREVDSVVLLLEQAPVSAWRNAVDETQLQVSIEQRLESKLPNWSDIEWPLGRGRPVPETPVGLVLDGLGFPRPAKVWQPTITGILAKLSDQQKGALIERAFGQFVEALIKITIKRGVLLGVISKADNASSTQLAKVVPQAFALDYMFLKERGKEAQPDSLGSLYWLSLVRGWNVAVRIIPANGIEAQSVSYSIAQ